MSADDRPRIGWRKPLWRVTAYLLSAIVSLYFGGMMFAVLSWIVALPLTFAFVVIVSLIATEVTR